MTPSAATRRRALLPLAVMLAACSVVPTVRAQAAAAPRSYGVLSELARELLVITFQPAVGSNLDANRRQRMAIPGGAIDRAALSLVKVRLAKLEPQARVSTFQPLDSDVFDNRQGFTVGSLAGVPPDLTAALRQQGSTHLLLLTRHQADAAISFDQGKIGSGRMEGLGFYIDNLTEVDRTGQVNGRGFLAPFVYIRATLIDVASGRVLRSRVHLRSTPVPASSGATTTNPWDALDATQKVRMLTGMLDEALDAVIPPLLAGP